MLNNRQLFTASTLLGFTVAVLSTVTVPGIRAVAWGALVTSCAILAIDALLRLRQRWKGRSRRDRL